MKRLVGSSAGFKGSLHGSIYTYQGDYLSCPKFDQLIKEKGGHLTDIETKPLFVEINADISEIKLQLPFPRCLRRKSE